MGTDLLTPRLARVLARIGRARRTPFHAMTPQQARTARLYVATSCTDTRVLLYFHGGGFVLGGLDTHDSLCRQLALRSGAAVPALDYRLAPEHPFPAAWDDAWSALRWLAECDPAVDDGIAYADRLRMAGVAIDLEISRGVTHDFMKMGRALPEASQALDAAAQALMAAWKGAWPG